MWVLGYDINEYKLTLNISFDKKKLIIKISTLRIEKYRSSIILHGLIVGGEYIYYIFSILIILL